MDLGLYIHIPFCLGKCPYCDFLSVPFDDKLAREYVKALSFEMRIRAGGGRDDPLDTIYLGGGTPSILPPALLEEIFRGIRDCFTVSLDVETTIEANPGTVTDEIARKLESLGVTRVSLGVQSFNDNELATLGRLHTAEDALKAIDSIKHHAPGVGLSVDLIYGIPGQTEQVWKDSLRRAVGSEAEHVSCYELTPEQGTPLEKAIKDGFLSLPDEDTVSRMFLSADRMLPDLGYRHYEISNYALPGRECRHNMNYWQRGKYIGLGAGAHSFDGTVRSKNTDDIKGYIEKISAGISPSEDTSAITAEEAFREELFLGLRLSEGLDAKGFTLRHGLDLRNAAGEMINEGLLKYTGDGRLCHTPKGMLLSTPVTVRLLNALGL